MTRFDDSWFASLKRYLDMSVSYVGSMKPKPTTKEKVGSKKR